MRMAQATMEKLISPEVLWFTAPAMAGTAFFLIRLVMLAFGGIGDADGGVDTGFDAAGDPHGEMHHGDSGAAAQFLSVQGVTAFMMGFGWTGYAFRAGMQWSPGASAAAGLLGGILMVLLVGSLFRGVRKLEASGTLDLAGAKGSIGEVYANVPAHGQGSGQVRLVLQQRQRIVNAISEGGALPTKTRVRIVQVNADRTVTVTSV
jgi:hypothetical protein